MKREIKFRARHIKTKRILGYETFFGVEEGWAISANGVDWTEMNNTGFPNATREQFTDLLDKHGKEIYEGDIIKGDIYKKNFLGKVVYMRSSFFLSWEKSDEILSNLEHREVIGNIYEGLHRNETPDIIEEWTRITGRPYPKPLKGTKLVKKPEEKSV